MFVYLSKKIAIPNNVNISSLSWNSEQGWIACGGANGMLKVLKLDARSDRKKGGSPAPSGNLSMNQSLEGHNGAVVVVNWNENYRKLTTSDQNGLIIVWMLHKGMWFEEMINNRNKSIVKDMDWNADGQKICIVYEDGAVIVGSVDGNRLWGKELGFDLTHVEWSPNGRVIAFGTSKGEVHLYDSTGGFLTRLSIFAVPANSGARLVGLHWYNGSHGFVAPNCPRLAICYDNGKVQINVDEADDNPVLIDTGLMTTCMRWNTDGSVLAIAGTKYAQSTTGDQKQSQVVQFYTPFGDHLRSLKIPGSSISAISWEGGGLRLALGVGSFIYFANIRPDYKWCYFNNTLVYAFNDPNREDTSVMFWNTSTNEKQVKYVKNPLGLRAAGQRCVFATKAEDDNSQYILILCNALGAPVDSKYIDVEPVFLHMTEQHVIAASPNMVYVWQYATTSNKIAGLSPLTFLREGREVTFHIDEAPNAAAAAGNVGSGGGAKVVPPISEDPVVAVTASSSMLLIARASGALMRYSLPALTLEHRYSIFCRPQVMSLNCNSRRAAIIDINGTLSLFDLESRAEGANGQLGETLKLARKDTWDVMWSTDNPEMFASMEKQKMYIFRGINPEEPVTSSNYLCDFSDLCIKAANLDDIMFESEKPTLDMFVTFDTKSLRDTRDLLATVPIAEAFQFVEDHPHPRLWRLIAESGLDQLNLLVAEKAFVHCADYAGIQFVKRLKMQSNRERQKAEVASYFKRFDEAENVYLQMGNKELAIELRQNLGDWGRVVQLIQSGGAGDDRLLQEAYNHTGDYYADRQKWSSAFSSYFKGNNMQSMAQCAYMLDNYAALKKILGQIPDGSPALRDIGDKFMSVGMCSEAVQAFVKAGDAKAAIDCCVLLNQWDQAVQLAEQHRFPQIEGLLTKYANVLLQKDRLFQAVELYRKAGKHTEAARLLGQLANKARNEQQHPLRAKQLYVLAGLEMERFRKRMLMQHAGASAGKGNALQTLQTLLDNDAAGVAAGADRGSENPWHGAEAYHFFLLAQRQLYAGQVDAAMKTALRLSEYEDILSVKDIYSLIALTAFHNRFFGQCSKAFIKLETQSQLTKEERDNYEKLALAIFTRHSPKDPRYVTFRCTSGKCEGQIADWDAACSECDRRYPACIITGRSIMGGDILSCRDCKHSMHAVEARNFTHCPLCHSPFKSSEPVRSSSSSSQFGES